MASLVVALMSLPAVAATQVLGRVEGAGQSIVDARVTLWMAGAAAPRKLAETRTKADGSFALLASGETGFPDAGLLYLIAEGGSFATRSGGAPNPAIKLLATLHEAPRDRVTINELTTIASAWTAVQFLDGTTLRGNELGLRIAAGNVPNFVDLTTGKLGPVIQDPLNSSQTTTLAKFNTLGALFAACITARPKACDELFAVATTPAGDVPTDTLSAAGNIARHPWHRAADLFALFDELYPVPPGSDWRDVPHIPYLNYAPRAWTLSLAYSGGGLNSLGGIAIVGEGNMWADDNFLVGAQSTIFESFGGGLSKLAPNGKPLSPMTTGFRGGGFDGPGFGIAISADDKVWTTSLAGKNISAFYGLAKPVRTPLIGPVQSP